MKAKLLINVTSIRQPLTGIGYYTLNILNELLARDVEVVGIRNASVLQTEELKIFASKFLVETKQDASVRNVKRFVIDCLRSTPGVYKAKSLFLSLKAKRSLAKLANQGFVYFEPSFIPLDYDGSIITTVHDLSFLTHPEFHPDTRVKYLTDKIRKAIDCSGHVMVDSNFILQEINAYYPATKEKASAVYLGAETLFQPYTEDECSELLGRQKLKYKKFLLSVATLEPRKNLTRLVNAYKILPESIRAEFPLVLVGDQGWKNSELLHDAHELIERNQIILTGYVDDLDLKKLYASASIFVYPSLYEGFGLPVVEAMASGVPVITSIGGATEEVARGSAQLVDPYSEKDIASSIEKLLALPELRIGMSENGVTQAKSYTWENTVDELLSLVETVK